VYEDAASFSEGLARVRDEGLYGFIDKTGRVAIEMRFKEAGMFKRPSSSVGATF
jgi:hypothetical protein